MKYIIGIVLAGVLLAGGWYYMSEMEKERMSDTQEEVMSVEPVLTIATSFYPLQFAAERIAGNLATVINIGEGRDPHDVQLSTQDVLAMQQSDLVVVQGADLEPWGDDIIEQLEAEGVPVHIATNGLKLMEGEVHGDEHEGEVEGEEEEGHEGEEEGEEEHGEFDPHTWLDPVLFNESVTSLRDAISALDTSNTATYEANATALLAELAGLNVEHESRLVSCELDEVITSHDAFGYLGERYGFEIHAIAGISTQDLPSATVLAELREEAEEGVGAILLESNSVDAYGETLANETGLQTLSINPIAFDIPEEGDYLSVMRSNLETFATALNCNG